MKRSLPALATILLLCTTAFSAPAQTPPNILIILADDLGDGDVQCYNPERGKIPAPHIDKLASQGMRFTDGHSSSGVTSTKQFRLKPCIHFPKSTQPIPS